MSSRLTATRRLMARGSGLSLFVLGLMAAPLAAQAEEVKVPAAGSPEREAMERVIHDYLMDNPEVLIEALHAYEAKRQIEESERQKTALLDNMEALTADPNSPVIGNPDGDVVMVEFFDYRCGYCRASAPRIQAAIEADPQLKVVMKEFPILSKESVTGARAALAADKQGKYGDYHFALMENPGDLSMAHLRRLAEQVGIDPDQLEEDMQADDVNQHISDTHALAQALGIGGTPAFVIGEELIPGAVDLDTLLGRIASVREAKS